MGKGIGEAVPLTSQGVVICLSACVCAVHVCMRVCVCMCAGR